VLAAISSRRATFRGRSSSTSTPSLPPRPRQVPVAGHIPGARSSPTTENLDAEGRFREADQLRTAFAAVGVTAGTDVGVYCGSGVTAAHEVFALERAGITAALYPGSWSEWITDPERPVATGE
jgi:thiosulfate/3-mercaptopyruvate sulfurtransferase